MIRRDKTPTQRERPKLLRGTASRPAIDGALGALARGGFDVAAILGQSGLDPAVATSIDARFPFENALAVWEHAAALTGDPDFGLNVAAHLPEGYGVLEYVLGTSPTLLSGYQRLCECIRIAYDASDMHVVEEPHQLRIVRTNLTGSRHYDEFAFGTLLFLGRQLTGVGWSPISARFRHPAPADTSALRAAFRCPISFGEAAVELAIDRAHGSLPMRKADPALHAVILEYARGHLAHLSRGGDLIARVNATMIKNLELELPRLPSVARALKLPPRALQRELKELGTSFVRLLDELRRALALQHLSNAALSVGEIAYLLHFSEVAAFNHAFFRWMNATPTQYRARLWTRPAR